MSGSTTVKTVKVVVAGDSTGAQGALDDLSSKSSSAGAKIKESLSGLYNSLSNTGMFSGVTNILGELSSSFDSLDLKGKSFTEKLSGIGIAAAGAGATLTMMAQGDEQAQAQLQQAITNTGGSYAQYKSQIDAVTSSQTKYGYTSEQVSNALQSLIQMTGSTTKGLKDMSLADNLAAAEHSNLGDATKQLAMVMEGRGTEVFSKFGITVTAAETKSKNYTASLDALSAKINGQANASVDTLKGKMNALRAEVENGVVSFAEHYGPAITMAGAGVTALSGIMTGVGSVIKMFQTSTEAAAAATDVLSASQDVAGVSADSMAAGETAADAAGMPIIVTVGLIVAAVALLALGIYELVTHWSTVFATMKAVVEDCWNFIDNNFIQPLESFFSTIVDFIEQHWQLVLSIITGPVGAAIIFVITHFNQIVDFFEQLPGQIAGFMGQIVSDMETFGKNIVSSIVSGIESMGSAIFDAIKKHIPGSGVVGQALGAIGLAEGGIVTKPTLAMIGEAGYPEAVIPLKNGATAMGFNDAVSQLQQGMFAGSGQGASTTTNPGAPITVQIAALTNADPTDIANEVTWSLGRLVS